MKKYLQAVAAITFPILLAVAAINYAIDPYNIYHFDKADSATLSRIDQFYHMRLTKPWHIRQLQANAVIVGTSRSASIKPRHPAWQNNKAYNLSAPGMTVYEMLRFIEHAQATTPLKKLMLGLDFQAFITDQPRLRPGFDEQRFAHTKADLASFAARRQVVTDIADTLLSMAALSRSATALTGTGNAPQRKYLRDGTWSSTSRFLVGKPGYVFVGSSKLKSHDERKFQTGDNFALLADILRFCHRHNIETRLVVTPIHVFMVDWWHRLGYAAEWRRFHQQLVAANAAVASEFNREPFKLLGFNAARGIVDEPVYTPQQNDAAWFQDGIHFKDKLGSKIMRSTWGENPSFGQLLTEKTVLSYLADIDKLAVTFRDQNAGVISDLQLRICRKARPVAVELGDARIADGICVNQP